MTGYLSNNQGVYGVSNTRLHDTIDKCSTTYTTGIRPHTMPQFSNKDKLFKIEVIR
jgi:hypothetical protein